MMTSKPVNADSENDAEILASDEASYSVEKLLSTEEEITIAPQKSSEENRNSLEPEKEAEDNATVRIELPEPDAENITVLTHKLPNKPILPWNRYDSPWEESEAEQKATTENEEKQEHLPDLISSNVEQEEETVKTDKDHIELDEVE